MLSITNLQGSAVKAYSCKVSAFTTIKILFNLNMKKHFRCEFQFPNLKIQWQKVVIEKIEPMAPCIQPSNSTNRASQPTSLSVLVASERVYS